METISLCCVEKQGEWDKRNEEEYVDRERQERIEEGQIEVEREKGGRERERDKERERKTHVISRTHAHFRPPKIHNQ